MNTSALQKPRTEGQDRHIEPLFVTVKTATRITGLSSSSLYEMLAAGAIEGFKVGGRRLIKFESLRKLASAHTVA